LVTAADAAGPVHEEVSTGEVLQSASAEETADASEKLIRIVKEKTRMSAEIEVEHRGDVHNDVLRKNVRRLLAKVSGAHTTWLGTGGWGRRVDNPTERLRRYDTGWWFFCM
jgi:hypothetical protein